MESEKPTSAAAGAAPRSASRRAGSFVVRHRVGLLRAAGLLLLAIIVLQNVEPTRIDLLFWSLPQVPKLVLILASMALGGLVWELTRRILSGSGKQP